MNKLLIAATILFSFTSTQVFSKQCDLSRGLNSKQIKSLKKARRIKRIGLNAGLLGKHVYEVSVLSNLDESRFVVFLGEAHIKGPRSAKLGAKVVKAFPVRMLEGVPSEEVQYVAQNLPELNASIGWQRVMFSVLSFNFFGSTISHAQKKGATFYPGYEFYSVNKKRIKSSKTNTAEDVLQNINTLKSKQLKKGLNLPLEVGSFITPSSADQYILVNRNLRMVENISTYLGSSLVKGTPLVIVGAAHNKGMIELMEDQGFEECSNQK